MKKYKLKTHKATAKRFKVTATGKIIRKKLQNRNNSHAKSIRKKARKLMPKSFTIKTSADIKKIKRLLVVK